MIEALFYGLLITALFLGVVVVILFPIWVFFFEDEDTYG